VLKDYYNAIESYLMATIDGNFIFLTIVITTSISITYFIVISYIVTQLDTQYFLHHKNPDDVAGKKPLFKSQTSMAHFAVNVVKIIIGICLLMAGLVMLVLPGQGLITMLIGLSLMPFPGKQRLENNILARQSVRYSLNWIRKKANKTPFIFD
tara:strand:- start:189 stop:647 length:459 start_codon:yes stop_codon:yes gene_type:complete